MSPVILTALAFFLGGQVLGDGSDPADPPVAFRYTCWSIALALCVVHLAGQLV